MGAEPAHVGRPFMGRRTGGTQAPPPVIQALIWFFAAG
jgi:hypothetical protein